MSTIMPNPHELPGHRQLTIRPEFVRPWDVVYVRSELLLITRWSHNRVTDTSTFYVARLVPDDVDTPDDAFLPDPTQHERTGVDLWVVQRPETVPNHLPSLGFPNYLTRKIPMSDPVTTSPSSSAGQPALTTEQAALIDSVKALLEHNDQPVSREYQRGLLQLVALYAFNHIDALDEARDAVLPKPTGRFTIELDLGPGYVTSYQDLATALRMEFQGWQNQRSAEPIMSSAEELVDFEGELHFPAGRWHIQQF